MERLKFKLEYLMHEIIVGGKIAGNDRPSAFIDELVRGGFLHIDDNGYLQLTRKGIDYYNEHLAGSRDDYQEWKS